MSTHKLVPRFDTPAPEHTTLSRALPQTLVAEHLRRPAVCAAIGAGLWTYGVVMDTAIRPWTGGASIPRPSVVAELAAIPPSAAIFPHPQYPSGSPDRNATPGLPHVVVHPAAGAVPHAPPRLAPPRRRRPPSRAPPA